MTWDRYGERESRAVVASNGNLPAHRRYPKSPSCACDGALDDGCPMCTPEKRTPEHNVSTLTGHPVFSGCSCHGVDEPVEVCHCRPDDKPCVEARS